MERESKFLKAYCKKYDRYYGLEMKQLGAEWRVVNMIDLGAEEARLISSELEGRVFETSKTLVACRRCGNRQVGGCGCAKRAHPCSRDMKYHFDCIYCDELSIDHSAPESSSVSGREDEKIVLSQGQEVRIRRSDNSHLSKIYVGVGWDPANSKEENMDVDSSVILLSDENSSYDLVYFGNTEHPSRCVLHHGDNLTGEADDQEEDDENITVWLDKVPRDRDRLVFVLNIYKCEDRQQTLDAVKNLYIKLYDPDSGSALIEYRLNGNMGRDTALVIGMAFRKSGGWSFKAIGKSLRAQSIHELAKSCTAYL